MIAAKVKAGIEGNEDGGGEGGVSGETVVMFDTVMEDEVKGVRVGGVESTTTDYGMVG